ncbi:amidohydrolase [Poronia punctata]|nr:amidohydrolase [Poronia punctata]
MASERREMEQRLDDELPSYNAAISSEKTQYRLPLRRSRLLRNCILAYLALFVIIPLTSRLRPVSKLSIEKLQDDLEVCSKLRSKPKDPIGAGRDRNARYIDGHQPTLIKNATIWIGEPAKGTSAEDARAGIGYSWVNGDVFLEHGLIKKVQVDKTINVKSLPTDTLVWDAQGRRLTSGIIDMHSHAGIDSIPDLWGTDDTNELGSDITPYVRSIDGINPNDHQIQVIKSGGVTTSLVLPGSGNNIGGEAFVIKHAVGRDDGRNETSAADMLADPDRNWRYIKMACGENAKFVYGKKTGEGGPTSRLGESWKFRQAFEQATRLVRAQDDWCEAADTHGVEKMDSYLPQDLEWETLSAVLRGQVHVNTHCYTITDLEAFVDHTNEFKFPVRAFHHAHQTYLVPEILKRAWGDSPPASALFADNMWYKSEAYIGSEYAGKILYENGLTPIYVSDNPVLNAQHVVLEAAKAFGYGLPYHAALASVTTAPAERLGFENRLGKIKPGFDADIVVWDSDPLSAGATPVQVWIDGTAQYEDPIELEKPFDSRTDIPKEISITVDDPVSTRNVIITGISKSFLPSGLPTQEWSNVMEEDRNITVIVLNGLVTCVGECVQEIKTAQEMGAKTMTLENGYITKPFTAFGSLLGLNVIDAEPSTDNGGSPEIFSRGIDGLALDNKKLHYAQKYGVTRAISAPKYSELATHQGTSVGFRTGAKHALEKHAVFAEDAAVHYTLDLDAKKGSTSISNAVGSLRRKLLEAVHSNATDAEEYSESVFLAKVVNGSLALAVTAHSADVIAAILRVKNTVDEAIASTRGEEEASPLRLVIIGGAESPIVADELAKADVGVVLSPVFSYRKSWDQRRALTGAPLTNGTAVDVLVGAGVTVAIGLEEDWVVRDLGLLAGIAYKNGGGRIDESQALDLVSSNVYKLLGLPDGDEDGDFVVFEGSPLEIGGRVRVVADGLGDVKVYDYVDA